MSNDVTINLNVDTSNAHAQITEVAGRAKQVISDWFYTRRKIIREVQQTYSEISQAIGLARQAISLVGASLDPFFSALLTAVMSTVSIMLSIASAMAATGVGIPASVAIGVVAMGLQAVAVAKIVKDQIEAQRYTDAAIKRIDKYQVYFSNYRSGF